MKLLNTLLITLCATFWLSVAQASTNTRRAVDNSQHYFSADERAAMGTRDQRTILDKILDGESQLNKEQHAIQKLESAGVGSVPRVGKFADNIIYNQYYTDSVYHDYVKAFFDGYNMQTYEGAVECEEDYGLFLNTFHQFSLNMTRRRSWVSPYRFSFKTAGQELNDAWFNCFQFGFDFFMTYWLRAGNFVDFGDVYLSFIFNLLSNSISIKINIEKMIKSFDTHDTIQFYKSLGSITRATVDFESYQTLSGTLTGDTPDFLEGHVAKRVPDRQERALMYMKMKKEGKKRLEAVREERRTSKINMMKKARDENGPIMGHPLVTLQQNYTWGVKDYVQAPFAVLIGALHALPADSFGYKCSRNTTSLRAFLIDGIEYAELYEVLNSATAFYESFSYLDEVGIFCLDAFLEDLNQNYWNNLFAAWYINIPVNLAYNAGFMWVDTINYIYYTPETVPDNDFGFFTIYLFSDFLMRIFYHDPSPQRPDN